MKTFGIIQLTGHTSEINFFKYIKVTSTQSATQIAVDSFLKNNLFLFFFYIFVAKCVRNVL